MPALHASWPLEVDVRPMDHSPTDNGLWRTPHVLTVIIGECAPSHPLYYPELPNMYIYIYTHTDRCSCQLAIDLEGNTVNMNAF